MDGIPRGAAHAGAGRSGRVFVGTPGEIAEQARPFLEAGVEELIVELPDAHNLEHVQAAAETLKSLNPA